MVGVPNFETYKNAVDGCEIQQLLDGPMKKTHDIPCGNVFHSYHFSCPAWCIILVSIQTTLW